MSSEFLSRMEVSEITGINYFTVYDREKKLGIFGKRYTDKNIELIKNFEKKKKQVVNDKIKISVIQMYLITKDNSYRNISERLGMCKQKVGKIIKEWIDNDKCILVDSKINY